MRSSPLSGWTRRPSFDSQESSVARIRSRTSSAFSTPPLNRTCVGQASPWGRAAPIPLSLPPLLPAQEASHLARDRGSAAYGSPSSCKLTRRCAAGRSLLSPPAGSRRPTPVRYRPQELGFDRPTHQSRAAPQNVTACSSAFEPGRAAFPWPRGNWPTMPDAGGYPGACPFRPAAAPPRRPAPGQYCRRPADVVAHRHSVENQVAAGFGDADEGEIGGAAADIHHQHQIADFHALAPIGRRLIQA